MMIKNTIKTTVSAFLGIFTALIFFQVLMGTFITDFILRFIAPLFGLAVEMTTVELIYLVFASFSTAVITTLINKNIINLDVIWNKIKGISK